MPQTNQNRHKSNTMVLTRFLPFLGWFQDYNIGSFKADVISGLTVALVLIPQSMAYAQLAGLPAQYGLYSSFLPPIIAALFGSSRQMATGPVAVVSLMTAASLEPLATAGTDGYIAYAILLSLIVGVFQLTLGVLKLGLVVNFLSHPVVNGFTNAAAIIIASSQFSKIFGVHEEKAEHHYETVIGVFQQALQHTHWPTLFLGVLAFAIMYGIKRVSKKAPNVLIAVVVTTAISWMIGFERNAVVNISAIESAEVRQLVGDFNLAATGINSLAEKRTEAYKALDKAKLTKNAEAILETQHEIRLIGVKIERSKDEAQRLRAELRKILFVAQEHDGRSLSFRPKNQASAGMDGDGRLWRIKVGNDPLPADKAVMLGGGAVVGAIPGGLPALKLPQIDIAAVLQLLPFAAVIALLGFMEAISIAKAMAAKTGQRLDPNQELIGQGLGNCLGAIGQSYPTSGSFSRSAVSLQAGAITGLSSVITGLAVVIVLMVFTPLLYHLPQSVLAAVIMMAVIGLINISGFVHAWKAQRFDGAISVISFASTLAFAPHLDKGIMIGVFLSLAVFLYKSMRPTIVSLSKADDDALRDAGFHGLKQCEYIAVVRFDGPLFFANASYLENRVSEIRSDKPKLKHILLVCNGISDMDASGEESLSLLVDRTRSAGIDFSLSGVNRSVMAVMKRTHLLAKIGEDHVYPTTNMAIYAIHDQTHSGEEEDACPLITVCRVA